MKNSRKYKNSLWSSEYWGGFNWALVAIIAFAVIFFFNVLTANVQIPVEPQEQYMDNIGSLKEDQSIVTPPNKNFESYYESEPEK
jgi:hypothetical protein